MGSLFGPNHLYDHERAALAGHLLPHGDLERDWMPIARYPGEGDGYDVEIDIACYPAHFFRVRALDSKNSVGEAMTPFTLTTGSGMGEFVAELAKHISEGMIGIDL